MTKLLPLLLAGLLATPVHAFDVLNQDDAWGARKEKPAKAPREKNDGKYLEHLAKSFGAGVGVGAAGGAVLGTAVLNPVFIAGAAVVIGEKMRQDREAKINSFYSGALVRGRVDRFVRKYPVKELGRFFGVDMQTAPAEDVLNEQLRYACLDVDGPSVAFLCVFLPRGSNIQVGDIVDVQSTVGVFYQNVRAFDNLHFDFNKHMPRVVNVYCKANNPTCQDDYNSSLGVISRPNLTEFPPSQYLIDPAIIAADQAKMRQEEADKKAAQNSGGFNFM